MKMRNYRLWVILVASCCLTAGSPIWAQGRRMVQQAQVMNQRNPLALLKRAIQNAGAPALTSAQEQQLLSLIQNYRASRKAAGPDASVQDARQKLDDAVLSGSDAAATSAAGALASALAANLPKNLAAQAAVEAQIVAALQPQASALEQKVGNAGFLRLVRSLAGGLGGRIMTGMVRQ